MGYTHSGRGASPAPKASKAFQGEKYFILLQADKSCWDLDVIGKIRLGRREEININNENQEGKGFLTLAQMTANGFSPDLGAGYN